MKGFSFILLILFFSMIHSTGLAQEYGELIMNPKLMGETGSLPINTGNGYWIQRDGRRVFHIPEPASTKDDKFTEILITGMVPDVHRRWAYVLVKDEEDLISRLKKFRQLRKEGKEREARRLLRVRDFAVSQEVSSFFGQKKLRDMPEKVGTFFLLIPRIALEKSGWFVAILSHTVSSDRGIVGLGDDFGEEINGLLELKELGGAEGESAAIKMRVIKARLTDESLREQTYVPVKVNGEKVPARNE